MTCAMPSTPLSGVRISWLMLARKADFDWLAVSAVFLAFSSSRSRLRISVTSTEIAARMPFDIGRKVIITARPSSATDA